MIRDFVFAASHLSIFPINEYSRDSLRINLSTRVKNLTFRGFS